jgi:hypothetical protein
MVNAGPDTSGHRSTKAKARGTAHRVRMVHARALQESKKPRFPEAFYEKFGAEITAARKGVQTTPTYMPPISCQTDRSYINTESGLINR